MIKRCTDLRRVKHLASKWELVFSNKIFYLVEEQDGEDLGVIVFVPMDDALMIHVELGEKCRGSAALKSCVDAFRWIFNNTDCESIIAEIPLSNRPAHFIARQAGMNFDRIEAKALRCYRLTRQMFKTTKGHA